MRKHTKLLVEVLKIYKKQRIIPLGTEPSPPAFLDRKSLKTEENGKLWISKYKTHNFKMNPNNK